MNPRRQSDLSWVTDEFKKERAEFLYGFLVDSPYRRGEPLEEYIEQLEDEKGHLAGYIFDICDYFGLPFTNNADRERDLIEIGDFIGAVLKAVQMAGYAKPEVESKS